MPTAVRPWTRVPWIPGPPGRVAALASCALVALASCARSGFVVGPWVDTPDAACLAPDAAALATDTQPPELRLLSPQPGERVAGEVEICARASDDLRLTGVRFWLGPTQLGAEDAAAPFCHTLDSRALPDGPYQIEAVARDAAGHEARDRVSFVSANGVPLPGVTHYVCDCAAGADADCVAGSDSADGLSPDSPQQTAAAAQLALDGLTCADALRFCAGGAVVATAAYVLPVLDCAPTPARVGAYRPPWASGDEARPLLLRSGSGRGIALSDAAGPVRGVVIEDLHLRCEGCARGSQVAGVSSQGFGVTHLTLQRCEVEGFDYGAYLSATIHSVLAYNHFHHALRGGIAVGGPQLEVLHNLFTDNGCGGAPSDDACAADWSLFVGATYPDSATRIVGNEIARTAVDSTGACRGVALQLNGGGYGARVEGNYIHEPLGAIREGCGGIQAAANGDGSAESCVGCAVQGNRIENTASGIVIAAHQDSVVANNTIALPAAPSSATPCAGVVLHARLDALDAETTRVRVVNNAIAIGRDDASCTAVHVQDEGTGHVVANNAILYDGTAAAFDCFRFDGAAAIARSDNNLCHRARAPGAQWVALGGSRQSLQTWRTTGNDLASSEGPPGFVAAAAPSPSFEPLACDTSLIDRGDDTLCPATDQGGQTRPLGQACDIGAFER